uniref:Uncharacterized protein n=1 Tax=Micrurus lemniscatus lemniscatus TaxID=129467 RepID=A0A2D4HN05_MICLE
MSSAGFDFSFTCSETFFFFLASCQFQGRFWKVSDQLPCCKQRRRMRLLTTILSIGIQSIPPICRNLFLHGNIHLNESPCNHQNSISKIVEMGIHFSKNSLCLISETEFQHVLEV